MKKLTLLSIIFLILGLMLFSYEKQNIINPTSIFAEDDDEEENEEEEEDDDDERRPEVYEEVLLPIVTKVVDVLPLEFVNDSDGDKLVDAIDPNPNTPEWDFFTDDDLDSVPNALDRYPGEDDFSYIPFEDINKNGINDAIELL